MQILSLPGHSQWAPVASKPRIKASASMRRLPASCSWATCRRPSAQSTVSVLPSALTMPGVQPPPSLLNIFKELETDLGCKVPNNGCLKPWADQGVLLLNTVLTVREHQANSHHGQGWEIFTDRIIELLNAREKPMAFILWGTPARRKKAMITNPHHYIVESPHPSPLSASRGFFGSRPFSRVNDFLKRTGQEPIDWQLPDI